MPDGKRNSLPPEGETDGVNGFYDDELQNATGLRRKLPLNHSSRGFNNLSDRLLKTMVANEIKKTLEGDDNKKLVAHHRPVLNFESETSESEMVVVGVVLNSKQAQNEDVSKAIDMLRRNGVSCVCFTLKDSLQNGDKQDDNNVQPCENGNSSSTEELLKAIVTQRVNENLTASELKELSPAQKKVSSPTVSTTSDYASPPPKDSSKDDDVIINLDSLDNSCTSTTSPPLLTETPTVEKPTTAKKKKATQRRNRKKAQPEAQADLPPTLPETLPTLFPQVTDSLDEKANEDDTGSGNEGATTANEVVEKVKTGADCTALRRKKRRKRMYPYLSRRKSRSKKKKETHLNLESVDTLEEESVPSQDQVEPITAAPSIPIVIPDPVINVSPKPTQAKEVDPYEFEDSDIDSSTYDTFKTPSGRGVPVNCASSRKRGSKPKPKTSSTVKKCPKKKSSKRSPRKRLTFSKSRAFSPDITDHIHSATLRQKSDDDVRQRGTAVQHADINSDNKLTLLESCVQPISTAKDTALILPSPNLIPEDVKLVLPHIDNDQCDSSPPANCDESMQADTDKANAGVSEEKQLDIKSEKQDQASPTVAQESVVQTKNISHVMQVEAKASTSEFVVPAPPDDSLHDDPDSMQLRRSSFYSSISRNVRTNLEKYLDGRPQDLKPAKRSKKIKNGFLLHHGDNFPDDPEAPYRLHLATQVLLKLNKRRVKCKPKEDKGKSLLSYLKLQPKRVSRVGKNSKVSSEENEESSSKEPSSVFSGEWTVPRKYICNICGQVENAFWDMVMHKGEVHPGIVVTHVELSDDPPEGFRRPPSPRNTQTLTNPPPCTKCTTTFTSYADLHRHIFECAGNASVLDDEGTSSKVVARKKKTKRKRGFKRRISGLPKKNTIANKNPTALISKSGEITKRRNSEVFKCEFCTREFKTEGWLKNHVSLSHSLPISIPLNKLSLPTRASISSSRRFTAQVAKPTKELCRES